MTAPPPSASPWLWLLGVILVSGVGWILVRAQRRALDAGAAATTSNAASEATTALTSLVERAARVAFEELKGAIDRLKAELADSRAAETALELRVELLEAELHTMRRWTARLVGQITTFGVDPVTPE